MEAELEIWKNIPGYNGQYQASTLGNIRNSEGHILRPNYDERNYVRVALRSRKFRRCRVVASTFIPNPENKPQVNHKNGVHSDDSVTNLEWVTPSENAQHWVDHLSHCYGSGHPKSKFSENDIVCVHKLRGQGKTLREIAEKFHCSTTAIHLILNGSTYRDRGVPRPAPTGMPKGSKHAMSKLNEEQVTEIKSILLSKAKGSKCGFTMEEIGKRYGVTGHNIAAIRYGKTWKHVSVA